MKYSISGPFSTKLVEYIGAGKWFWRFFHHSLSLRSRLCNARNLSSRAPAAHPETTRRPAAHSKTTGGRAPWEHPVENSRKGGRALENIDSNNTGRVARERAVSSDLRHRLLAGQEEGCAWIWGREPKSLKVCDSISRPLRSDPTPDAPLCRLRQR